ncbi:MAG: hypothetical protein HY047_05480 [Acidobacteria bacterium]|nr:hypothetical protein [Acidobacteriota bacterium]
MPDDGLQHALDALSQRLHADIDRQIQAALNELSASRPARPEDADASDAVEPGAAERLVAAIHDIGRARSLTEILDTLVSSTNAEATRVAVFLVRGDRLQSWRLVGFDVAHSSAEPLTVSFHDAGILADAVRTNTAVADATGEGTPSFAAAVAEVEGLAVPIALSREVVAVLYADNGSANAQPGTLNPESVEILTRYGARCLEVLTAFKVARAMAHPEAERSGSSTAPEEASAEADVAAQRYARLLVLEIKLYHEAEVVAGRQEGDLATRLGGEIARARGQYEQRVPPTVQQRVDYFHDELVRTLANGDPSLLVAGD